MNILMPFFARQELMVYRKAVGAYVSGRWVDGAESSFTMTASSQPASGEDLKNLPEGTRSDDARKVYADTDLYEENEKTGQVADEIDIDGERYKVQKVFSYNYGTAFGYNKALITRI